MLRVAVLVWIVLGVVLAGALVIALLNLPAFSGQELKYIPIAAAVGYIVAIPFAAMIAKAISKSMSA